jgi:hypothetical protein
MEELKSAETEQSDEHNRNDGNIETSNRNKTDRTTKKQKGNNETKQNKSHHQWRKTEKRRTETTHLGARPIRVSR